jgi:hypothetical protein
LPASSTLGGDAVDAAPPAAAITICPSQGCSVSRAVARAGFVYPARAQWPGSQAPLSHPSPSPGIPSSVPECPIRFSCAARHGRTRSTNPARLPPAGPIGRSPRLRSGPDSRAATGTLALPPRAQLPTCFYARLRRTLDTSTGPAFTGAPGPHAAHRLLQRSAPRAHLRAVQTPAVIRNGKPLRGWMTLPLAGLGQPSCFRPGVALTF